MTSPNLLSGFLDAHPVFRKEELTESIGEARLNDLDRPTMRTVLKHWKRDGRIETIRPGLFAVCQAENKPWDPYLVVGRSEREVVLGYRTALAWHLGKPCPPVIHLITRQFTRTWAAQARHTIHPVQAKDRSAGIQAVIHCGMPIQVTTRERTLIDLLDRPDLAGAREDVWKELQDLVDLGPLDLAALLAYLQQLRCKTTTSKVAFFLHSFRDSLNLSEEELLPFGSESLPFVKKPVKWDWTKNPEWKAAAPWTLREDLSICLPSSLSGLEETREPTGERDPQPPSRLYEAEYTPEFLRDHLEHHFRFNGYLPGQQEALARILEGRDTLAILPTGSGKSLIYLQASLLVRGPILVISPLISLIHDQVRAAVDDFGLKAYALHFKGRQQYLEEVRRTLAQDRVDLLLMPPEGWRTLVRALPALKRKLGLIAIDEAHVLPPWGGTFRRAYRTLGELGRRFPKVPMLALTATATVETQKEIIKSLGMKEVQAEPRSVFRANLYLMAREVHLPEGVQARLKEQRKRRKNEIGVWDALFEARWEQLEPYLRSQGKAQGIIYCPRKADTKALAKRIQERLGSSGLTVEMYNGEVENGQREEILRRFKEKDESKRLHIIVATVAFGMGINVPTVRFVVHCGMPNSLENYAQEIGRAGRDDGWAECLTLWAKQDLQRSLNAIGQPAKKGADNEQASKKRKASASTLEQQKRAARRVMKWLQADGCRHGLLDAVFGVERSSGCLHSCDRCKPPEEVKAERPLVEDSTRLSCLWPHLDPALLSPLIQEPDLFADITNEVLTPEDSWMDLEHPTSTDLGKPPSYEDSEYWGDVDLGGDGCLR